MSDESGQKMSKSKGNVVDPMTLIEDKTGGDAAVGADVLRITLLSQDISSDYIPFHIGMLHPFKIFTNKMWQTLRMLRFNAEKAEIMDSLLPIEKIP